MTDLSGLFGSTLIYFRRNGKDICVLLKEGEKMDLENIIDVWVTFTDEPKDKDSDEDTSTVGI